MTELERAAEWFQNAVASLERASLPLVESRSALAQADTRIAALIEERDALLARIADLEEEARAHARLSEEAERRVENAIAEVRNALDH